MEYFLIFIFFYFSIFATSNSLKFDNSCIEGYIKNRIYNPNEANNVCPSCLNACERPSCQDQIQVCTDQDAPCQIINCIFQGTLNQTIQIIGSSINIDSATFLIENNLNKIITGIELTSQSILLNNVDLFIWQNQKSTLTINQSIVLQSDYAVIYSSNIWAEMEVILLVQNDLFIRNTSLQAVKLGFLAQGNINFQNSSIVSLQYGCKNQASCSQDSFSNSNSQSLNYKSYISFLRNTKPNSVLNISEQYYNISLNNPLSAIQIPLQVNFTFVIICKQYLILKENTQLSSSYLGLYASQIYIDNTSNVSTEGRGCVISYGRGCGFLDWVIGLRMQCGGTGASHGGIGGQSTSIKSAFDVTCVQMTSKQIYDNFFDPLYEGSGGGGQHQDEKFAPGGGVIYMEASKQIINEGTIISSASNDQISDYFGGGSGGSIQLHAPLIFGNGYINATGAGSKNSKSYGGIGAGGRIKLNMTYWYSSQMMEWAEEISQSQNLIYVNPGNLSPNMKETFQNFASKDQFKLSQYQGSVYIQPCLPGFGYNQTTKQCKRCLEGYFNSFLGQKSCFPCINSQDAKFDKTIAQTQPICQIIGCSNNKIYYKKQCLSQMHIYYIKIGGFDGAFTAIVLLIIVFLNLIYLSYKIYQRNKQKSKKKNRNNMIIDLNPQDIQKIDQSSAKIDFVNEDLPYHIKRVYLKGVNFPYQPWSIYDDSDYEFETVIDMTGLKSLFQKFNVLAQYNQYYNIFLYFLKFYYYPLYYIAIRQAQRSKFKQLQQFLLSSNIKTDLFDTDRTGTYFKFSCSSDNTLGYIDILNYKRDILIMWNNQAEFPLSFVVAGLGTFLYPLTVHMKDPIIRLLITSYAQSDPGYNQDDEDNNYQAQIQDFFVNFNNIARLIDYNQSQTSFIIRFISLVQYIEDQNNNVFLKANHLIELCVHQMGLKDGLDSKVIVLSLIDKQELENTLGNLHTLYHTGNKDYNIKITVNFDKVQLNRNSSLNEQIIIKGVGNINRQIDEYKRYEEENVELNNLKSKMKRKLLEDLDVKKSSLSSQNQYIEYVSQEQPSNNQKIQRQLSYFFAYFTRYRFARINPKVLTVTLFLILLFEWTFALLYPVLLYLQATGHDDNDDKTGSMNKVQTLAQNEFIVEMIIFPFSSILAPFFLTKWVDYNFFFLCFKLYYRKQTIGKTVLLFNLCGCVSSFICFVFGIFEILSESQSPDKDKYLNLIKIIQLFVMVLLTYLACLQLNIGDNFGIEQ